MAHYLFNSVGRDATDASVMRELAVGCLGARMWGVDADQRHRDALVPGDLVLIHLGAPVRVFIGRAELATAVHEWTPSEARAYPGDSPSGVALAQVEVWDPPVPMASVLAHIDPSENAKADLPVGVVRITAHEYAAALAAAAEPTADR